MDRFGLLQISCSAEDFEDAMGAKAVVGRWYEIFIGPKPDEARLRSKFAALTNEGYTILSDGFTFTGGWRPTPEDKEPPRRSLGAAAVPSVPLPKVILSVCTPAQYSRIQFGALHLLSNVQAAAAVRVRDVGQANFVSLENSAGRSLLHFDVGVPTAFLADTAPLSPIVIRDSRRVPIILSHWDWDHLHCALKVSSLRKRNWIVPDQILGPGAARLALGLARKRRLFVWPGGQYRFPFGLVANCAGANRNDSGLAVLACLTDSRKILLTGDADYSQLPASLQGPVDGLVGTHHGAKWSSQAPVPTSASQRHTQQYVLSYGPGNPYGHPHPSSLRLHRESGWASPSTTSGRRGQPRGDRLA